MAYILIAIVSVVVLLRGLWTLSQVVEVNGWLTPDALTLLAFNVVLLFVIVMTIQMI